MLLRFRVSCLVPLPMTLVGCLLLPLTACEGEGPRAQVEEPRLGPSLEAGFQDPLLLTLAAPRQRSRYLEDEGYTLARDPDGAVHLATDTAGDLGFALKIDDYLFTGEADWHRPAVIRHISSDTLLYDFEPLAGLSVEARFAVATSRVAVLEIVLRNQTGVGHEVTVMPWLRRCGDGRYDDPLPMPGGVRMSHRVTVDFLLEVSGPGTYLEGLSDALVVPGRSTAWVGLPQCGESISADVHSLSMAEPASMRRAAMLGLPLRLTLPSRGAVGLPVYRGAIALERAPEMPQELAVAQIWTPAELLTEGARAVADLPSLPGLSRGAALVYRSSHVLLQQLMMPAEGEVSHDYYLLSREPTWWFARLGQQVHESLAMILMAHLDPEAAMGSHRIFMERVGINGYLPYSVGPVVDQAAMGTASAPLFSYVAWEIGRITGDASFIADAYEAGQRIHDFWVQRRDQDGDGLAEWGGHGVTESMRDLENVIWDEVAPPAELEAICLNSLLVKDASVLGEMAEHLGLPEEAQAWRSLAEERAERINAQLWDEETGFYYHVTRDGNTFDHSAPGDLKRMEIVGLLPLWAGFVPPERRTILLGKLTDPELFWRSGGVPALAATDPYYDPEASSCCRWRGPVWVQWQLLVLRALLDLGEDTLAVELTRRVLRAVEKQLSQVHQFRELYDPDDPEAPNASMPNYISSALVALMMRETAHLAEPIY